MQGGNQSGTPRLPHGAGHHFLTLDRLYNPRRGSKVQGEIRSSGPSGVGRKRF